MISADLVTAAVLITFGVLYGFTSPTQLVIICLIEPLAMKINEHIVVHFLHVSNHGNSVVLGNHGNVVVCIAVNMKITEVKRIVFYT